MHEEETFIPRRELSDALVGPFDFTAHFLIQCSFSICLNHFFKYRFRWYIPLHLSGLLFNRELRD